MTAVTERPRVNRLVLSRPGKRIVVLFIVLGVLALAGSITVSIVNGTRATHTAHKLDSDHAEAVAAYATFAVTSQQCAGQITCLHGTDAKLADALETFRKQFDGLTFPPLTVGDAQQVRSDIDDQIALVRQMEAAAPAAYNQMLGRLQELANRFNEDYQTLRGQLPG
jgi:hypothetical protein